MGHQMVYLYVDLVFKTQPVHGVEVWNGARVANHVTFCGQHTCCKLMYNHGLLTHMYNMPTTHVYRTQ